MRHLRLAQYLCENIGGAELAYGQSDEISILVRDDQNIDTDAWFDKRLQHKKWAELQEMCWQKDCNWNNLTSVEKRGFCVYRQEVVVDGRQGPVKRMKFLVDRDIPIFTNSDSAEWWSRFLKT